ncbi:hypothetical protein [Bacillus toyonensis]|uniref:hypothetical protein n=1 Tax=Bacillus toyonensis TaxID=155322 RepID=UPI000BFD95B6|nr:hypothetical protein [Bacillus toyonensis]PHG07241.1 hypothetical protein COI66_18205 [Bacillus toyonensis]
MVKYILEIESLWRKYALLNHSEYALKQLLERLNFVVKKKSKICERKWIKMNIPAEEFESVFFESIWKLCDGDNENIGYSSYGTYYFYEMLLLILERREIDLVRKYTTKQSAFELSILPLKNYAEECITDGIDIEDQVINKRFVQEIIYNSLLENEESNLLLVIYKNSDWSYEKIAKTMGLKHHEKVRRILKRINKKLNLDEKSAG